MAGTIATKCTRAAVAKTVDGKAFCDCGQEISLKTMRHRPVRSAK